MNADASQAPLSLGWFLLIAAPAAIVCAWVWLRSGMETADRALADLPTDDQPADDRCGHEGCEQAREIARGHLRLLRAVQEHEAWQDRLRDVARTDALAAHLFGGDQ